MAERDQLTSGLMIKTTNGNPIQNPLVGIANRAMVDMVRYAAEFGMTRVPAAASHKDPFAPDPRKASRSFGRLMAVRNKAPRPPLARALRYAEQVIDGRIPACQYVARRVNANCETCRRRRWPVPVSTHWPRNASAASRNCLPHIKGPMAGQRIELAPGRRSS